MIEKIPHCALMRRSGGCHLSHLEVAHGDPPPATQCWLLGWGGSRTPIKYYGGFPPPSGLDVIVGREPNHQQSRCYCGAGAEPPAMLDVGQSALPRPPQPPKGGKSTARRGPTHKATPYLAVAVWMSQIKTLLNIMGHIISGNRNNIPIMSSRGFVVFRGVGRGSSSLGAFPLPPLPPLPLGAGGIGSPCDGCVC